MRFNFIGQQANFGEGITPLKANEKELLVGRPPSRVPSPKMKGKKKGFKKKLLNRKEVMDGSKV